MSEHLLGLDICTKPMLMIMGGKLLDQDQDFYHDHAGGKFLCIFVVWDAPYDGFIPAEPKNPFLPKFSKTCYTHVDFLPNAMAFHLPVGWVYLGTHSAERERRIKASTTHVRIVGLRRTATKVAPYPCRGWPLPLRHAVP